jgi:hypothetical protein
MSAENSRLILRKMRIARCPKCGVKIVKCGCSDFFPNAQTWVWVLEGIAFTVKEEKV